MIIIEGMDNSGKSTLAVTLALRLSYDIRESEGPPRDAREINDRCRRYSRLQNTVFVRHPVISNAIYGQFRPEGDPIEDAVRKEFYAGKHLIIYCDQMERGLLGHDEKDHDSPEHLAMIREQQLNIRALYREWAIHHAHVLYRIGDDMDRVCDMVYDASRS